MDAQKPDLSRQEAWAALIARGILGLLFFMAGWFKVFELGVLEHARRFFIGGYHESWIPLWLLWALGTVIPFVELIGGLLVLLGYRMRLVLPVLGCLLLIVTYGHLLNEPLFDITSHIFPRAVFLIFLLWIPGEADRWSLDGWLTRRRARA